MNRTFSDKNYSNRKNTLISSSLMATRSIDPLRAESWYRCCFYSKVLSRVSSIFVLFPRFDFLWMTIFKMKNWQKKLLLSTTFVAVALSSTVQKNGKPFVLAQNLRMHLLNIKHQTISWSVLTSTWAMPFVPN